jgi:hypothetical protein
MALALLLMSSSASVRAEWQVKPFVGLKFGGNTNLVGDLEFAAGRRKPIIGVSTAAIGEIVGLEADVAYVPGYFEGDRFGDVLRSSLTTVTGNIMVGLPRRMTEYTLRPYFVGGAGLLRAHSSNSVPGLFELSRNLPAIDLGGGVTGFITPRTGVSWEVRHFRNIQGGAPAPGSTNDALTERLSFWRANMALAIRY